MIYSVLGLEAFFYPQAKNLGTKFFYKIKKAPEKIRAQVGLKKLLEGLKEWPPVAGVAKQGFNLNYPIFVA